MSQFLAALEGALRVLVAGVILGAGLPALFSYGVRHLAAAEVPESAGAGLHTGLHKAVAYAAFTLALLAVLLGLAYIVAHGFGVQVTFDGLIPVITR